MTPTSWKEQMMRTSNNDVSRHAVSMVTTDVARRWEITVLANSHEQWRHNTRPLLSFTRPFCIKGQCTIIIKRNAALIDFYIKTIALDNPLSDWERENERRLYAPEEKGHVGVTALKTTTVNSLNFFSILLK